MNPDVIAKMANVGNVYTPSYPIEFKELFSGRHEQLQKALSIIPQKGLHAIVFGDRGVGKTSFANILKILMESPDRQVHRISCNSEDTLSSLWRNILAKFTITHSQVKERISFLKDPQTIESEISLANLVPADLEIRTTEILDLLSLLDSPIIIIDEFDRLEEAFFNKKVFTDVLKAVSDTQPNITIIIVGVSEDISTLIQEHESIERNLGQIYMPVMSTEEIKGIILRGEEPLGIRFDEIVVEKIVSLSSGYPHFTHSLCYHAAQTAILLDSNIINSQHLQIAIQQTTDAAHESLRNSYRIATLATKQNLYSEVLYAASIAPTDEYGYFQANDLEDILTEMLGKEVKVANFVSHLGKFCTIDRGEILKSSGTKNRQRYKFKNPLMRAFIRLKSEKDHSKSEEKI